MIEDPTTGLTPRAEHLKSEVRRHLNSRQQWAAKQKSIMERRMGQRPIQKLRPYRGAPNFVEPIIDDNTRQKTDDEVAMWFNTPRVAHAFPMGPVDPTQRATIEEGFDSYLRYILNARPKIEEGMDLKNAQGVVVFKLIREWNFILQKSIPSFTARHPLSIIVPSDTEQFEKSEFIADFHWMTPTRLRSLGKTRGWKNVEAVIGLEKQQDRAHSDVDDQDPYRISEPTIGLEMDVHSNGSGRIPVCEVYHVAEKREDIVEEEGVLPGNRAVCIFPYNHPELIFSSFEWMEDGKPRPWPFVCCKYEDRDKYYYGARGLGHLLMDSQIEASQIKNMTAVMREYYQTPLFEGPISNSTNINFEPGSMLPSGVKPIQMPSVPQQLSFDLNQVQMQASRRAGAQGLHNFSTDLGNRKVEKTATEVDNESARASGMSSTSVDRFNHPFTLLYHMLWQDMKRMELEFPILNVSSGTGPIKKVTLDLYEIPVLLIPASNSKHLNPDNQMGRHAQLITYLGGLAQQFGLQFDVELAASSLTSLYDSRLTAGWIRSSGDKNGGQMPVFSQLQALHENVGALAENGKITQQQVQQLLKQFEEMANTVNGMQVESGANLGITA